MNSKGQRNIIVQIARDFKNIDFSLPKLKKLVKAICNRFKLPKVTVSIAIVDDARFRKLNQKFLNRSRTSDCLSFDLSDDKKQQSPRLFELIINGQAAIRQARLRGHSSEAELSLYVTHGLLHNVGFDDSTNKKAKKMHDTEDEILQQLGYGLVYKRRAR